MLAMINTIRTMESPLPTCQLLFCLKDCSMTLPISRDLASAEKIGNNESCQSRYKYHCNAADDAGDAQRQYDF